MTNHQDQHEKNRKNAEKVKDIKNDSVGDLRSFFDNFVQEGVVTKEKEVIPGFNIKLRTLNTGELMQAESIVYATDKIPSDIVVKVRSASILSQAILKVNGIPIEQEDAPKEENRTRRSFLYQRLLDMSPYAVQMAYELYIEAVQEQNKLYKNEDGETEEKIKNF